MATTPKAFKPSSDQIKLIVRALAALHDIDKRAERAHVHYAIKQIYADEQVSITALTNLITSSELEF